MTGSHQVSIDGLQRRRQVLLAVQLTQVDFDGAAQRRHRRVLNSVLSMGLRLTRRHALEREEQKARRHGEQRRAPAQRLEHRRRTMSTKK